MEAARAAFALVRQPIGIETHVTHQRWIGDPRRLADLGPRQQARGLTPPPGSCQPLPAAPPRTADTAAPARTATAASSGAGFTGTTTRPAPAAGRPRPGTPG